MRYALAVTLGLTLIFGVVSTPAEARNPCWKSPIQKCWVAPCPTRPVTTKTWFETTGSHLQGEEAFGSHSLTGPCSTMTHVQSNKWRTYGSWTPNSTSGGFDQSDMESFKSRGGWTGSSYNWQKNVNQGAFQSQSANCSGWSKHKSNYFNSSTDESFQR